MLKINLPDNLDSLAEQFRVHGFVILESFFDASELRSYAAHLREDPIYQDLQSLTARDREELNLVFSRASLSKNMLISDAGTLSESWFAEAAATPDFAHALRTITGRSLLRTNNCYFEVSQGTAPGIDWHTGYYSFPFTRIRDFGCSIWVPLDPVDGTQGGGLKFVSKSALDGSFVYQFADAFFEKLSNYEPGPGYIEETVSNKYMVNALGQLMDAGVPEGLIQEPIFKLGDIFLFDKNLVHTSAPLRAGTLSSRRAMVCRFIDADSRYEAKKCQALMEHVSRAYESQLMVLGKETEAAKRVQDFYSRHYDPFFSALLAGTPASKELVRELSPVREQLYIRLIN